MQLEKQMLVIQLALNAFDCIKYAILYPLTESAKKLKGKIEADEAYFGEKEWKSWMWCQKQDHRVWNTGERWQGLVNNVKAKTLLASTIRKIEASCIQTNGRDMIN